VARKGLKIGVDLGTVNTLVYIDGYGVIFNEPSVVAFDKKSKMRIAAGAEASDMLGKTHKSIHLVKPMEGGVVSDLDATGSLLQFVFERLHSISIDFSKSTLLICYPSVISQIEKNAMIDLAKKMGVYDVFLEEEVKAGALGAGMDIFAPEGSMVVDIGGGTTDIGILSLGDLVVSESIKIAGNHLDNEIMKYMKQAYHLMIGPKTAEKVKIQLGTVKEKLENDKEFTFAGRDLKNGLPRRVTIKQSEIRHIFLEAFDAIDNTTRKVLMSAPPELSSDIYRKGITVNGGGALVDGIKEHLEKSLSLKINIAPNALTSIVEGSKILLKNRGNYLVKPLD